MCGRYTLALPAVTVSNRFQVTIDPETYIEHYNAAPGQNLPVITNKEPDKVVNLRWGLIPFWAKDMKIGYKMINARKDSLLSKPAFKHPVKEHRCLVLGDSYFEWIKKGKEKIPYRIMMKDEAPFAMAGLWSIWKDAEERPVYSFSIITVAANEFTSGVHDRMPAILLPKQEKLWLDNDIAPKEAVELLNPYPDDEMKMYQVSTLVNSAVNDVPDVLKPCESKTLFD